MTTHPERRASERKLCANVFQVRVTTSEGKTLAATPRYVGETGCGFTIERELQHGSRIAVFFKALPHTTIHRTAVVVRCNESEHGFDLGVMFDKSLSAAELARF